MNKRIDNTECHYLKLHRSAGNVGMFYDRILAPSGVTARQYSLLYEIGRLAPCTISELAEAAELDRTTLARSLKPLFKAGLVEDRKEEGTRNSHLVLTENDIYTRDMAKDLIIYYSRKGQNYVDGRTKDQPVGNTEK